MTPSEYKQHKGIQQENLRDHMNDLELIFSMLGKAATKEMAVNQNAKGFDENRVAAKTGDRIADDARRQHEQESGKPVISKDNYLGNLASISVETQASEFEDSDPQCDVSAV